ncbi:MAG: phosphate acyltransferase PlsX [Syntrophomonadaceae bacterium]|jgi:glycerol-3-phosphate acyltransferase PlsX|nr:phosphate acyltransferase PlsX [Syntrophomonadaceae bacterium]
MRIAVDAMGGDFAPAEVVRGALQAARSLGVHVVLVGDESRVRAELDAGGFADEPVTVVHCTQVVEMNEHPALALRRKKDASIAVATGLVREGKADAVVSCGSTGAQMAAAVFILGLFPGIERPAIAANLPMGEGCGVLLDVGANVDCKARQLVQFALMGSAYANALTGVAAPRVALLSNGEEESKGSQAVVEAHARLRAMPGVNFVGNVEGRELFSGSADVIVCDGFVGNIVLKTVEGLAAMVMGALASRLGAAEVRSLLAAMDYNRVGGAPLLGVEGVSVVCHGSSRAEAVANGIGVAARCVEHGMVERVRQALGAVAEP